MDLDTCNKIVDNISKRYNIIGRDWIPDGSCVVKIRLPEKFSPVGGNIEVDFTFDEVNGVVYSDMKVIVPYSERLWIYYASKKPTMFEADVYTTKEDNNLVYKFTVGEVHDYSNSKTKYEIMQGWFIDDMINGLMIEKR
ncbi:MAG: hypothetical protein ACP5GJ_03895 [Nanopusillaceae archaeon]